jgi:hypothetical protein
LIFSQPTAKTAVKIAEAAAIANELRRAFSTSCDEFHR